MEKHFSKKVLALLAKKGVSVIGAQAVPAFEGDRYFTGTAYQLVFNGASFMRTYSQVETMAVSSWQPETDSFLTPSQN